MILVVAYHVSIQGFGEAEKTSSALPMLVLLRMPLFFFISGFLAYKADMNWTPGRLGMMVWKKIKIQMLPTIIFLFIALAMRYRNVWDGLLPTITSPTKGGYWFTWVLLQMFIIYYLFAFIESRFKQRSWIPITILWFISLCAYAILYMPSWFHFPKPNEWAALNVTSFIQVMRFFHFFVLGNIVHRYWQSWQRLMDSKWFFTVVTILVVICCFDIFKWHTLKFQWTNLPRTTIMYGLLMIVFMTFRHYKDTFSQHTRIGRAMAYIGVRTLDIYLIHFLLLPNLKMVGEFINTNKLGFVVDVTESTIVALLVIAFCILISNTLRVSPVFKKYLFGRK